MAKTVYVDPINGVDANPGTNPAPVKTFAHGNSLITAGAGDTLVLEPGRYLETVDASTSFAGLKNQTTYQGFGNAPVILDGGWKRWCLHSSQGTNVTLDKLEMCNAIETVLELDSQKGTLSNFQINNCHFHHADSTMGPPQTGLGWNSLIRFDFGNPQIRNSNFHHCGHYNEAYGIFLDECTDAVVDSCVGYFIRKQFIRDFYSLYSVITNNFGFACEGALDMAGGFGALVANNFVNRSDYGMIAKHCNNPTFLSSVWGMTQSQLKRWTTFWHNTIYDSMGAHMELAINLTGSNPDYLEMTEVRHNIFAGSSYISLYDEPTARTPEVFTDYNIHPTNAMLGQGLYRRGFNQSTWTVIRDLAAMHADPIIGASGSQAAWETHGQQLDPTFVDAANNNLNPTTDYRASISLPSQWGDQIGARGAVISPYKWQHEPVITITGSTGSATQLARLVDDYGAITNFVMDTNVEALGKTAWIVCDLGSAKPISAFRWTPWSHDRWDNVQDFKIETASSTLGPWTTVLTGTIPDYGGVSVSWDFGQTYTARFWRFTALTNFLHGANRPDLVGGGSDRLTFAEVEWGQILAVGSAPPGAPVNTVPPGISGTLVQNNTLTVVPGTWNGALQRSYRWLRDGTTPVGTGTTYPLVAGDVSHRMAVEETATGSGGLTAVATSALTAVITAPPSPPTNTVLPSISGTLSSGNLLTLNVGGWTGSPTFAYRLLRDGTTPVATGTIPVGQTSATYLLVAGGVGHSETLEITATNGAGSLVASSPASALVGSGTVLPPVSGSYWGVHA